MTHTTTDAAEARARAMAMLDSLYGGRRAWYGRGVVADAMIAFATAEPASGAGEREELAKLVAPFADYDGDLPDYDHPLRCVYESGVQYAVMLLAKTLDVKEWVPCDGTEEYDGDLGGTLLNIVLEAMPEDADGDRIHPRELPALLASLPPATDPAMGPGYVHPENVAEVAACVDLVRRMAGNSSLGRPFAEDEVIKFSSAHYEEARAITRMSLAAAPTIPATGEAGALAKMTALDEAIEAQHPGWMTGQAIPKGMKPWLGGDAPPDDWDGGRVLFRNGSMVHGCDVASWQHPWAKNVDEEPSMPSATTPFDIIAYTPKTAIPATGHAATEGEG